MDAKLERSVVIQGFMKAHSEIEKSGRGFGKAYWGSKWRFKIFDGLYTHPKDPETGKVVSSMCLLAIEKGDISLCWMLVCTSMRNQKHQ
jgi:hypothetical protein